LTVADGEAFTMSPEEFPERWLSDAGGDKTLCEAARIYRKAPDPTI
jgi:hypothetical protein